MASTTILSDNGVSSGSAGYKITAGNDGVLILQTTTSGGTATNALYVDTAQNIGLNAVPSAWISSFKALQVNSGAFVSSSSTYSSRLMSNLWTNSGGNDVYLNAGYGMYYLQSVATGQHQFYNAPSGSAAATATVVQTLAVGKGTTLALEGATSAAGTGIAFPASVSLSSNANTLDDYEEGTWTPMISDNGDQVHTFSATSATGYYRKIGSLVWISVTYAYNGKGTVTGDYAWMNLPFSPSPVGNVQGSFFVQIANASGADTNVYNGQVFISGSTPDIGFRKNNNAASPGYMTGNDFPTAGTVAFNCCYLTDQ